MDVGVMIYEYAQHDRYPHVLGIKLGYPFTFLPSISIDILLATKSICLLLIIDPPYFATPLQPIRWLSPSAMWAVPNLNLFSTWPISLAEGLVPIPNSPRNRQLSSADLRIRLSLFAALPPFICFNWPFSNSSEMGSSKLPNWGPEPFR